MKVLAEEKRFKLLKSGSENILERFLNNELD